MVRFAANRMSPSWRARTTNVHQTGLAERLKWVGSRHPGSLRLPEVTRSGLYPLLTAKSFALFIP